MHRRRNPPNPIQATRIVTLIQIRFQNVRHSMRSLTLPNWRIAREMVRRGLCILQCVAKINRHHQGTVELIVVTLGAAARAKLSGIKEKTLE